MIALRRLLLGLSMTCLGGCANLGPGAAPQPLAGFQPWAGDQRVWLEPGGEAYARRVSSLLDVAAVRVEATHGRPFRHPIRVHVCASDACFRQRVRTLKVSAAVVADNRLILSPALHDREAHRLPDILAHELSHVHLGQRQGHYSRWLPVWFHEGLATLAADGGGAEYASDELACALWRGGQRLDFAAPIQPDARRWPEDLGLSRHTYYRLAWRLLEYLRNIDPGAFRRWLAALQDDGDFHIAFADAYNSNLVTMASALFDNGPLCGNHDRAD